MTNHTSIEEAPRPANAPFSAALSGKLGRDPVLTDWFTEAEAAAELQLARRTLRKWRTAGSGPPYTRVGRGVRYPRAGIVEWMKESVVKPVRSHRVAYGRGR